MKLTTLEKVAHSLETMTHRVVVPAETAARARLAIDRMISIGGGQHGQLELSAAR
jgi:quinolinate synthase